jgi:hypothetical protein
MAWICSLYQILEIRHICPIYLSGYLLRFNLYAPLKLYVSIVFILILFVFFCVFSFECYMHVIILK